MPKLCCLQKVQKKGIKSTFLSEFMVLRISEKAKLLQEVEIFTFKTLCPSQRQNFRVRFYSESENCDD